uniref:Uncharacterized protein n=1 Tax=Brassica campestris TaxID=3711 RepID=A0A3P5Z265_BRACM|nr:unnamed protein product [Brassica rapa]
MATNACKFLCLILLFAFVAQGIVDISDISLKQSKTEK